jgi:peptidoglycan/LPS O-acetylase OafA/YrhL
MAPEHPTPDVTTSAEVGAALRDRALRRLKKRRDFHAHLLVYVLVNGFILAIWAATGSGFFWPVFLIVLWGIGVVMNAWDVYRGDEFSEHQIAREMERIRRT